MSKESDREREAGLQGSRQGLDRMRVLISLSWGTLDAQCLEWQTFPASVFLLVAWV